MTLTWRTQYDGNKLPSRRARLDIFEPSKTQLSHREDCDLNVLAKRFGLDKAAIPPAVLDPRYYGDMSDVPDLRTALDQIRDAQERFRALPAALRRRFANDPANLWDFVNDPENADEAVSLGLLKRQEPQTPPTPTPSSTPTPNGAQTAS